MENKKNKKNKKSKYKPKKSKKNDKKSWSKKGPRKNHDSGPAIKLEIREEQIEQTKQYFDQWKTKQKELVSTKESTPKNHRFDLDPWQMKVFDLLKAGESVIVDAPTTAGKTAAVERLFELYINNKNFRACYTTPVKSLSNDKLREFREKFGEKNVGIATGDIKDNLNAPIIVSTLECYRNSLLGTDPDLNRTLVILDEYHYLQDSSRGSGWEEAIILTPPSCQLLLLSASVGNGQQFCDWISTIRDHKCHFVQTLHRPVPLEDFVFAKDQWVLKSSIPEKILTQKGNNRAQLNPKETARGLAQLADMDLTPCIIYAGRRLSTESFANSVASEVGDLNEAQAEIIQNAVTHYMSEHPASRRTPSKLLKLIQKKGVAYHHSGLTPPTRLFIEYLLKNGLLRYCTATMGLSLGINFSVRSALISDFQRPDEKGLTQYTPSEVLQMLGRAGRRGNDTVGFSLWQDLNASLVLGEAKRRSCNSSLKNDPITFLGLIGRGRDIKSLQKFYNSSFLKHQNSKIDLSLVLQEEVFEHLKTKELPCHNALHSVAKFIEEDKRSHCFKCPKQTKCHDYLEDRIQGDLAALQMHLYRIDALDENSKLTEYGSLARYFPQNGGLIISKWIVENNFKANDLEKIIEILACFSFAAHKKVYVGNDYSNPFNLDKIKKDFSYFYPPGLFPDCYEIKRSGERVIREFNPEAGYILRLWLQGVSWQELILQTQSEKLSEGDIFGVILRVASYLNAFIQYPDSIFRDFAVKAKEKIARSPISEILD